MRLIVIGRSEIIYDSAIRLKQAGHELLAIVSAKEAPEYTKTSADLKALAESWGIPFFATPRIADAMAALRALPVIDLGISFNYPGIIPQSIIDLFPLGILNAHGGDLPRYRGNACQAWAILNGEQKAGLCIHRMIGGELDSGDIVAREFFPLMQETKVTAVYRWMSERIPFMFADAIDRLGVDGGFFLERQSKHPSDALRCYPRRPEDGLIDWQKTNIEILRLINACNKPYAGAFCYFEDRRMVVWDAAIAPEENFLAIPGQVTAIADFYIEVACGSGKILLRELEMEGTSVMPRSVFRSLRQRLG